MGHLVHVTEFNTLAIFLGLFMVIFMNISLLVQRIYLGAANFAFLTGVAFGPESAGFINPRQWSPNVLLEFSRVVLAIQCFSNAIELPKRYVPRHWRSLGIIIGPVMLCGWAVSTLCVKLIMAPSLTWQQAMACASCFNAIDPVLAQTILSGRISKKIPKHLRDLLRMEAAANGLTTTLVLDLTTYLLRYPESPRSIAAKFFSLALAYEVILGTLCGFTIGYVARIWLKKAFSRDTVDRPSFLAYYVSLALFSLGLGTIIGVDEVNMCFFTGVGLDNDNWYEDNVEKRFFSSCFDLLLNLSYFVFVGSLVPWTSFNSQPLDIVPWRLVVGTLCIFLLRRIPAMCLFKPLIPDVKTWREAAFYGHFGPIGPGALFSALLIEGLLTPGNKGTVDRAGNDTETSLFAQQIWVIAMFVFVCSSIVHGSSVAVFRLGRRINLNRFQGDEPDWMDRLSHIASRANYADGYYWHVEPSAVSPQRWRTDYTGNKPSGAAFPTIIEDDEIATIVDIEHKGGNAVESADAKHEHHSIENVSAQSDGTVAGNMRRKTKMGLLATVSDQLPDTTTSNASSGNVTGKGSRDRECGPARAYQYGNTIIIEDENGDVIKKYDIPTSDREASSSSFLRVLQRLIGKVKKNVGFLGGGENTDSRAREGE